MSQYISKDVLNFFASDYVSGLPLFNVNYCEVSTPSTKSNSTNIFGGSGGQLLGIFFHEKTSSMKIDLPLVDFKVLASIFGNQLAVGASNVYQQETLVVSATNTATLTKTPIGTSLLVYQLAGKIDYGTPVLLGTPATVTNTYSISGTTITLNATSNPVGSQVIVIYQYAAPTTSTTLSLSASSYPKAMRFNFDGFLLDTVTNVNTAVKITVPNCVLKPDFTVNFDFKNASKLSLEMDMLAVPDLINGGQKYMDYVLLT